MSPTRETAASSQQEGPIASTDHSLLLQVSKCFVALVTGATLTLSAAYVFKPQGAWWLELARYVPYPVYVLPAALALFVSLWLG